ncbi:MAG: histidine phosphatase family protein [Dehalococcoidales bacterium]|nr:histidine phosphatase family protein [Dehalococcoidales bacterium]
MLEIILTRHGETDLNAGEIFRGLADAELNETGLRQAELLGEYLGNEKIDIIYSSPLKRAVKTAETIARRQALDVNTVRNLIDFDYGEWQGLPLKEIKDKYEELYRDWQDTPEQVRIPGGESLEDVRNRAMPFVEDAVMRCGEGKIVFVSHRVVHKVLICNLLGLGNARFWNIRLDTGGISRFNCGDGKIVLTSHNDTSYLKPVKNIHTGDF